MVSLIPKPEMMVKPNLFSRARRVPWLGPAPVGHLHRMVAVVVCRSLFGQDRGHSTDIVERRDPVPPHIRPEPARAESRRQDYRSANTDSSHRRVSLRIDMKERKAGVNPVSVGHAHPGGVTLPGKHEIGLCRMTPLGLPVVPEV